MKEDKIISTVDAIKARNKEIEDLRKREEEKIKRAFDIVFNTEAGVLLGRYLVNVLNFATVSNEANAAEVMANTIRRNVYLTRIRPYLNDDIKNKMEN